MLHTGHGFHVVQFVLSVEGVLTRVEGHKTTALADSGELVSKYVHLVHGSKLFK